MGKKLELNSKMLYTLRRFDLSLLLGWMKMMKYAHTGKGSDTFFQKMKERKHPSNLLIKKNSF